MQISTSTLAALGLFKGLSEEHLERLVENAMFAEFDVGEFIFRQGEYANRFFVILDGGVALVSSKGLGRSELIQTIGPGDLLGWSWLFPPYYWHFDARAVLPVKAVFFYSTKLREECERDHDFGYELIKRVSEVLVKRLQATPYQLPQQPARSHLVEAR
jgi:CRP/FNR family transcriptional regulator, cyclic AMP receptor protein